VIPDLAKSAAYKRYLFSSYNKEKEVLKYVLQELNSEQILSKSLDYHIANQDALDVFEASDGFGTDEQKMAAVIIGRRPESIKCTDTIYQSKYGRTLEVRGGGGGGEASHNKNITSNPVHPITQDQVRGENHTLLGLLTGGMTDFGKFLMYRTMPMDKCLALLIKKCMSGMGCSDYNLMELLSAQTNADLKSAAEWYEKEFEENMVERIKSETDGMLKRNYGKWVATLCEWDRDESEGVPEVSYAHERRLNITITITITNHHNRNSTSKPSPKSFTTPAPPRWSVATRTSSSSTSARRTPTRSPPSSSPTLQ